MNNTTTIRSLSWLIALILLSSWNLQAEGNTRGIDPRHSVQPVESYNLLILADDLPPISLTATVGVPFSAQLPRTLPIPTGSSTYYLTVTGLPANGPSLTGSGPGFIVGTPLTAGVMNLTVVETLTASQAIDNATTWRAYTITINPSTPPTSLFSITGVTAVSCATVTAGERRLTFTPQYAGVTGQPLSFSVVNEMLPTISPGPYTLRLYTDNPTVTLKATQTGTAGEASFVYNWLAVCGAGSPPPPALPFSITSVTAVSCATVTAGERRLTFTPRYAGLNGQPVSFSVVNEMLPTISPGPYILRLYTDNPAITLKATQTGTAGEASFAYNWLAVCSGGGAPRLSVSLEPTDRLQVKLLGNPVREALDVEVTGSENKSLHLSLTDMKGRIVDQRRTEQAGVNEHYQFDVSSLPSGILLLRTSTQGQSQTVRILKVN